jgi:hypothetical protein
MLLLIYEGVFGRDVPHVVLRHQPHWHSSSARHLVTIGGFFDAYAFGITTH